MNPLPSLRQHVLEAWAVWVGIESGLFADLAEPIRTEDLLAGRAYDASALRPLLDVLVGAGHLVTSDAGLVVAPERAAFLLPGDRCIAPSFGFLRTAKHFESYPRLLREGGGIELSAADWGHVTRGSSAYVRPAVDAMVQHLPATDEQTLRILDVGCGSGDYAMELAARCPGAQVLAIDPTPAVAAATAERLAGCDRVEVRAASVEAVEGSFDIVLLNHVLHVVGAEEGRGILRQIRARLAPGGVLLLQELVRTPANRGELFGLMMRLLFPAGEVFDRTTLASLVEGSGLSIAHTEALGPPAAGLVLCRCHPHPAA